MYDPVISRFISPDPIIQDFFNPQALNRYSYVMNNPLRYFDPNGNFRKEANANKFVNFAKGYMGKPYSAIDCSKLVSRSLNDINKAGIKTKIQRNIENLKTGPTDRLSTNILKGAEKGDYNLQSVGFDLKTVQKGDLIATPGHVEIVSDVTAKGIKTIASSSGKGEVVERGRFDPSSETSWWQKAFKTGSPTVIKINEDNENKETKNTTNSNNKYIGKKERKEND